MSQQGAAWRWQDQDLILAIHAQPGAKRTEVAGLHDRALKIRVQARAVEGAANAALICFLAEQFEIPKRQISILQGKTAREKVLQLHAPDPELAATCLHSWDLLDR